MAVRTWNARIARDTPTTAAKAYRLLSTIMRTTVADELVAQEIHATSVVRASRRHLNARWHEPRKFEFLTEAMPDNIRISILLAAWCQLRRGEIMGLRRRDVDLERGTVTVAQTCSMTMAGTVVQKEPKTAAGKRTVAVPANVLPALAASS